MKKYKIFLLFFLFPLLLWSAEDDGSADDETEEVEEEEAEEIQTLREIRRDKIMYGIESEVLEVLTSIFSEKDDSYNEDLLELVAMEGSPSILEKVFIIFTETEFEGAQDIAMREMQRVVDDEEYRDSVVIAAMTYLGEGGHVESLDIFYDIIQEEDDKIVSYALSQLGKLGSHERTGELLDLFNEEENEGNEIAENIILAWGDLAYEPALDILIELVEDEYAEKIHREYAAVALGKIGDPQGFEPVRQLYLNSEDATLRSFALSALVYFDNDQVDGMLYQALRRDTYWKIRVAAAEGLGDRQSVEAVELLEYKLNQDPEDHVKKAAAAALGAIGNSEAAQVLLDYFEDDRKSQALRIEVLKVLFENQIAGTVEAFESVMTEEWEKTDTQGKFLEYCCREAALADFPAMEPAYGQMLIHSNHYIQIYGIRGIRRNSLTNLYDEIQGLDREGVNGLVRREASDVE